MCVRSRELARQGTFVCGVVRLGQSVGEAIEDVGDTSPLSAPVLLAAGVGAAAARSDRRYAESGQSADSGIGRLRPKRAD